MKRVLREKAADLVKGLSKEERDEKSLAICGMLLKSRYFSGCGAVFAYSPTAYEADISDILKEALNKGKTLALPVSYPDGKMCFIRVYDLASLVKGRFGIMEPPSGGEELFPCGNDLIIVPGVAFDTGKNRLGHGMGFYDRYFFKRPGGFKIGVAYGVQVFESIPHDKNDVKMDFLLTENGFI